MFGGRGVTDAAPTVSFPSSVAVAGLRTKARGATSVHVRCLRRAGRVRDILRHATYQRQFKPVHLLTKFQLRYDRFPMKLAFACAIFLSGNKKEIVRPEIIFVIWSGRTFFSKKNLETCLFCVSGI